MSNTASGCTEFTRTPSGAHSNAATRESCCRAALDAEYAAAPGPGAGTFLEPTTTTRPPIGDRASSVAIRPKSHCTLSTLTAMTSRQSSTSSSVIGVDGPKIPAAATTTSRPPKVSTPDRSADSMASWSVTSATIPSHRESPDTSTTPLSRSMAMTAAPRLRSSSAQARPIPEAAPVTRETTPPNSGGEPAAANLACSRSQYSTSKRCSAASGT